MNKKEFYKQLMSEYSFDADKIRENAKRGKSARQKLQPIYIGMSAAAAVCVALALRRCVEQAPSVRASAAMMKACLIQRRWFCVRSFCAAAHCLA